jgi:hypothetical protein
MAVRKGVGIRLDKSTITKQILSNAFTKIIDDPSFKKKAKILAQMIAKKPTKPDESIVKYAEFATEFDVHEALDIYGRNLSIIEFYNIDVLGLMFLIILTVLFLVYKLASLVLRFAFRKIIKNKQE